jgi:hypothetical protein
MTGQWLIEDKLYSLEEKVRIELGPQLVNLECTDENLDDKVTHRNYRIGSRDAMGRIIRPDEMPEGKEKNIVKAVLAEEAEQGGGYGAVAKGEMMTCVDWRAKHLPHVWKIYQLQSTGTFNKRTGEEITRFIQVGEAYEFEEALPIAENFLKEMNDAVS